MEAVNMLLVGLAVMTVVCFGMGGAAYLFQYGQRR